VSVKNGAGDAVLTALSQADGSSLSLVAVESGEEVLSLKPQTTGSLSTVLLSKGGLPVATVRRTQVADVFTVYAARAKFSSNGSTTSPVLYTAEGVASGGPIKINDVRGQLVATDTLGGGHVVAIEPRVDVTIILGVTLSFDKLR